MKQVEHERPWQKVHIPHCGKVGGGWLTPAEVRQIMRLSNEGTLTRNELCKQFHVNPNTIDYIRMVTRSRKVPRRRRAPVPSLSSARKPLFATRSPVWTYPPKK